MSEKRVHQPVVRYKGYEANNEWTNDEKVLLLKGLKKYGHKDISSIAKLVPSKSPVAVKTMILNTMMAARRSTKPGRTPPINMWLERTSLDDTNSLIPQALQFISLFERHPAAANCGGCDLRAAYDYVSRMTRNQPTAELSTNTRRIIFKAISKTVSKMRLSSPESLFQAINNVNKTALQKDYTHNTKTQHNAGPHKVLQELNTFMVPTVQLRKP
ncbi:uncharacterized protein LOC124297368 [Neodiprion virginianus]|uniref:uncharacterized protein LOC124174565 n=1 Tax=Neodiprion fabricii TaxID=2872261 RepID=UPI00076FD8C8|nr:uncharacterized protein LOC124174565 [Neodiprion fabricii]XP_046604270.1 uncharacterized protein LOC124297368 [Neodiprion virginianus]